MLRTCLCTAVNVVVTVLVATESSGAPGPFSWAIIEGSGPRPCSCLHLSSARPSFEQERGYLSDAVARCMPPVPFIRHAPAFFRASKKSKKRTSWKARKTIPCTTWRPPTSSRYRLRSETSAMKLRLGSSPRLSRRRGTNWSQKPTPWTPQKQPPCKVRVQHEDPRAVAKAVGESDYRARANFRESQSSTKFSGNGR
jgi:hypothetical protein